MENTVYKRYENFLDGGDAVDFLIKLMELQKFREPIKSHEDSFSILAGIIIFRHLDRSNQIRINKEIINLIHTPEYYNLGQKLRDIATLSAVQPYWFTWSLSDQELRDYYELNDSFKEALSYIGFDTPHLTVAGLAGIIYQLLKKKSPKGSMQAAEKIIKERIGYKTGKEVAGIVGKKLSPQLIRKGGLAGATVYILGAVMLASTKNSSEQAKKELLLRGLLKIDEV
ncbi:hypothetical protein [Marinobacterium stanieri]|uniref:hypothetical protein n=1 Tax=Marinobacterium stanieri TaxID=49186 RepID=UPI0002558BE6|nr:hypothetical protein [Marinobacterium stanieri]